MLRSARTVGKYHGGNEKVVALHITYHSGNVPRVPLDSLVVTMPVGNPFDPGRAIDPFDTIAYMMEYYVAKPWNVNASDVRAFHRWMLENRVALIDEMRQEGSK